jgi:hypothetical protein
VQTTELEKLLAQLIAEHKTLLNAVELHLEAMRTFKFEHVSQATEAVEASRTRVMMLETRRRVVIQQICRMNKLPANATLTQIADVATPQGKVTLLKLREELKQIAGQISRKTNVSSRVAAAMLGHLNTVVRLVAGAVQQAAVYTNKGMPTVAARIGVMEAVG